MPCGAKCKAAIDCTGYRCEMDNLVALITCGAEDDEEIIADFIKLQGEQEKMWIKFVEKNYDF
jgi:hypothetical protein